MTVARAAAPSGVRDIKNLDPLGERIQEVVRGVVEDAARDIGIPGEELDEVARLCALNAVAVTYGHSRLMALTRLLGREVKIGDDRGAVTDEVIAVKPMENHDGSYGRWVMFRNGEGWFVTPGTQVEIVG